MRKAGKRKERELNGKPYGFRLRLLFPDSIVFSSAHVLLLIQHDPEKKMPEEIRERLENFLRKEELLCGVSVEFHDFYNLQYACQQSRIVLQQAEEAGLIRYFDEDYKNTILDSLYKVANIKAFCHPRLLQLWQNGGAEKRMLLMVVETYLGTGGNMNQTAQLLEIHRNTLLHRLNRLAAEWGIELRNLSQEQRFYMEFSCMILNYLSNKENVKDLLLIGLAFKTEKAR